MDRTMPSLSAQPLSDFDEPEVAGFELDAMVGGLGPVPGDAGLSGETLDQDAFDASILAAMVSAR